MSNNNDLEYGLTIKFDKAMKDVDRFVADAQKQLDALQIRPRSSDSSRDNAAAVRKRDFIDEQAHAEQVAQLKIRAFQRIDQIDETYGSHQLARRSQLEANINSITSQASNRRIGDIQREVNANLKQFERQARAQQTAMTAVQPVNGKNLQYVFQAQQAIEDFSYAGLRGASNNIALMASQLGGPAGLIALLGITAVQVAGMGKAFGESESDIDRAHRATERYRTELEAMTKVTYHPPFDVPKTLEDVQRIEKAYRDAVGTKNALIDTNLKRESITGLLTQFKTQNDFVKSEGSPLTNPNAFGPEAFNAARAEIAKIKQQLQELAPNFDWDTVLGEKSYEKIDDIIKTMTDKVGEFVNALFGANENVARLRKELEAVPATMKNLPKVQAEMRDAFGLTSDGKFDESTALTEEQRHIDDLEKQLREAKADLKKAYDTGDKAAGREASLKANQLTEDIRAYKEAVDAVKKAERDQIDQAREALRIQKDKNREKESELKTQEQLLKSLDKEQKAQQHQYSLSGIDTRQGMTNNMLDKMKARDEQLIGMSPNSDWQKIMKGQLDAYYDNVQTASDRFYAKEKNQQLQAKANAAGAGGDLKDQRKYLEDLQSHQQQQAMNARTPQAADFWYRKSLETQKQIEASFRQQQEQEKLKIENIKNEIKSVDDLEKKIRDLTSALKDVPKLDLENQGVLNYLDTVDQKLADALKKLQQLNSGAGGGLSGGGGEGGSNPFAGLGDMFASGWGGGAITGDAGKPFSGVDWNDPKFGGAGGNLMAGGPAGGWGFGGARANGGPVSANTPYIVGEHGPEMIMPNHSGFVVDARTTAQAMAGAYRSLPQSVGGYGSTTNNSNVSNRNVSIGHLTNNIHGGNGFDVSKAADAARRAASNLLLRRGC